MSVLVLKFGGSSLATPQLILGAARKIAALRGHGHRLIVVASAMGDTTDDLLRQAREVSPDPPQRELDMLLTAGERISMALLAIALHRLGQDAISFTGSQSGIITDTLHTQARIVEVRGNRIREELDRGRIVIVAGFQGVSAAREITTLGRGGSDTTAVALAAAFGAARCDLLKDVEGVYTADPRLVPGARRIARIPFEEMVQMASLGAGVVHARCIDIARQYGVTLRLASSFNDSEGTLIGGGDEMKETPIRAVTQQTGLATARWEGVPTTRPVVASVLETIGRSGVVPLTVIQSPRGEGLADLTLVLPEEALGKVVAAARELGRAASLPEPICAGGLGAVSVIGQGVSGDPAVLPCVMTTLESARIRVELACSAPLAVTCLVRIAQLEDAVRALHRALIEEPASPRTGP